MGSDSKPLLHGQVLVVDDENGPRQTLRMLLKEDHKIYMAPDVCEAQKIILENPVDVVITDLRMPKQSGVHLLQWTKMLYPDIEVIILTGYANLDTAKKAVEHGALAYMEKPFDADAVMKLVQDGLARRSLELERRHMEELALEANRFETLGRFVSGMLHDLGTPLSVIGTQLEIMERECAELKNDDRVQSMRSQVEVCSDIVRSAMKYLRHESQRFVLLDMNELIDSALSVCRALLREHSVEVKREFAGSLPTLKGDYVLMRQAVLNLITNACQAMEGQEPPRELHVRTSNEHGAVCVSIGDTGPGIKQEDIHKVFDTFYTTKGEKGTGLGLAVVQNVMKRHRGDISVVKNGDQGALFTLAFPEPMKNELLVR